MDQHGHRAVRARAARTRGGARFLDLLLHQLSPRRRGIRDLEHRFGNRLVVIGVHSPKFPHESDHAAVERAVARHRIAHPVLDDPELETWQQYGVRAWPTLVVIDPDGYVVAMASGEGNGPALEGVIERLLEGRDDLAVGPAFA